MSPRLLELPLRSRDGSPQLCTLLGVCCRGVDLVPVDSAVLDSVKEGAGERLGVGERHHVAGAVDQRVLRVRYVSPDELADSVVDDGGVRSLDDVDR